MAILTLYAEYANGLKVKNATYFASHEKICAKLLKALSFLKT